MTFGARTFQGMSATGLTPPSNTLTNTSASTGVRSATVQLQTNGAVTLTNGTGDTQWFNPITTGIGNSYWVQLDLVTSTNTTLTGSASTLLALSTLHGWTFSNSLSTNEGTGTYTLSFYADAGGTQLVGISTSSWDVGNKP